MATPTQAAPTIMMDPRFRYTEDHHARYEQDGYCTFDHFLSADGMAACERGLRETLSHLQPGRKSDEIISPHHQDRWVFALATQASLLDMIEQQIGPDIILWSTAMVCKPPRSGRTVPWHQDAPYWNIKGKLAGGVWIPFDDVDASNGSMCILPGWHRRGTLPRKNSADDLFSEEIDPAALPPNVDQLKVQYHLKGGQAAVHDTMIPHNSLPNDSDRWRRVLVLRYASADSELPGKFYENYRTGEKFPREGFLVRGRDVANRGYRRSPFE